MTHESRGVYRRRIYDGYVTQRHNLLAPGSVAGLAPRMPYLRQLVRRHAPPDRQARILDLGCGHGAIIHTLNEAGYNNVTGVDASPEQVAAAKALGIPGVREGDLIETLQETPDGTVDCVISFDVIEHFTREELIPFVDEVYRVLRPAGLWIIHVPNGESPVEGKMRYWDLTHELAFTRTSLSQLLMSSGFESVKCFEDRPVPHGIKSGVRAILWRMIRAGLLAYIAIETGGTDRSAIFSQNMLAVAVREH